MIQYIIKALLNDDSIFINDLGTFTKSYQSARFDGDTMLPPQYMVTLTVKDDQPDSTEFINLVCREKQCRITEASAEINQWVEELKTAIENNKEVEFDNFGTFSLNNKGIITFVCDHIDELNREFEGMGIVNLGELGEEMKEVNEEKEEMSNEEMRRLQEEAEEKRLQEEAEQRLREAEEQERLAKEAEEKRLQEEAEQRLREAEEQERMAKEAEERRLQEERREEEERRIEEERRLQEEAEQRLKEAEEQEEKEEQEDHEVEEVKEVNKPAKRTKNKPRSWWWLFVLLILIALGVLGYLFRQQLTDTFHRIKMAFTATDEEVITEEDEAAVDEETATYEEETQEAQEDEVATEPEAYTPEVERTTATGNYPVIRFEQGHYYVIAGSLPTEQDAVRHIKQRNLDQYEPKIVLQNGVSNLRVCIGIFDTEEEAENFAKSVSPKYWVLK